MNLKSVTGAVFYHDPSLGASPGELHSLFHGTRQDSEENDAALAQVYEESRLEHIYHSNRLEGNSLTYAETASLVQEGVTILGKPLKDQLEARNLARALDFARSIALDSDRAFTQGMLRQVHALILSGIEDDAGEYRRTQNRISGSQHATPDPFVVPQAMTAWSDAVKLVSGKHGASDVVAGNPPLLFAAAAHALLLQIHPFSDGNGRSARVMLDAMLLRWRYPPCVITEDCRPRYIEALEAAWSGNLTGLVGLLAESIHAHANPIPRPLAPKHQGRGANCNRLLIRCGISAADTGNSCVELLVRNTPTVIF